ncbi:haloacid dehalogenase type II [Microbacterium rhizomatis]|uniref:Haloacid dehalogenase type II n=1 Tax=Microbacterium rhizomatis TaxID=1631477 RepID=A0A5J5IZG8_9MICO|nr:haloacid dehalogenase type II [Microbacterium rhizomatis]KAA9104744.1 haloacid dehalogenase type II [Microbacterium rhizomatis]
MIYVAPSTSQRVRAVIFDTFGTLVDWRTDVAAAADEFADAAGVEWDPRSFADAWRAQYQPSMAPIRAGSRGYVTLDTLHRENLDTVLGQLGIAANTFDPKHLDELSSVWRRLRPWADVTEGLDRIRAGYLVGPLSNANTALLVALSRHAGLRWDVVLGSDVFGTYKPERRVYQGAASLLGLEPGEVMLAAAHNDDLAGAAAAGLATAFIARPLEHGPDQQTDLSADGPWDLTADSVTDLASLLGY